MSQLFMLPQLVHDLGRSGKTWLEFLRVGVPCNVRELEQCARNVMIRGEYRPRRRNPAVHDLAGALEAGTLTAEALVRRYCTLVFARTGSYKQTARQLGLDRRTVKEKLDRALLETLRVQRGSGRAAGRDTDVP